MKQTAIDWLVNQNISVDLGSGIKMKIPIPTDIIEQAKAMEKEQIIKTYNDSIKQGYANYIDTEWGRDNDYTPEQYYNETYGK